MKQKIFLLMALLCLVVGKVDAQGVQDWKALASEVKDGFDYYIYYPSVGFLNSKGKFDDAPNELFRFSGSLDGFTLSHDLDYVKMEANLFQTSVTPSVGNIISISSLDNANYTLKAKVNNKAYAISRVKGNMPNQLHASSAGLSVSRAESYEWYFIDPACLDTDKDASGKIHNANANYNVDHCWTSEGTGNKTKTENGNSWFEIQNWNDSFTDNKIYQTVRGLENGKYKLTVDCQAMIGTTLTIFAGSEEVTIESKGNGWVKYEIVTDVTDGTLLIGAKASAPAKEHWANVDNFKLIKLAEITIPANNYTTYSNNSSAIDFSNSGLTVYYASSVTNDLITFTKIDDNIIPKGEGVLIKGSEGGHVVVESTSANTLTDNKLKAGDGQAHNGSYALASKKDGSELGFYQLNSSVTIPYGKAYLDTAGATLSVKSFILSESDFDDVITAIRVVSEDVKDDNAPVYSITGVKVGKNYKGLVIKNGKTYLQK